MMTPEQRKQVKHWMRLLCGPDGAKWRQDPDYMKWAVRSAEWILDIPEGQVAEIYAELVQEGKLK
jgi:hypothetical protein